MAATHMLYVRTMRGALVPQVVHDDPKTQHSPSDGIKRDLDQQFQIESRHGDLPFKELCLLYPPKAVVVKVAA